MADVSESIAGGTMCFSGVGAWSNQAQGVGFEAVTAEDIDRFIHFYVSRGVEPKIEVATCVDESLVAGLERRGFTVLEFEHVWACCPADVLPEPSISSSVDIRRVDPQIDADVTTFVSVTARGFLTTECDSGSLEDSIRRSIHHPRTGAFLATVGDVVVGGGCIDISAAVSCLFGASVIPSFRRQGVQAALIMRRLQYAREADSQLAVIHSAPGISTERNAARIGFRLAYSKAIMRMKGPGLVPSP